MIQQHNHHLDELVHIKNIKKYFPIKGGVLKQTIGHVKAVDDVSFHIKKGETLGIVGESGSGKSTLGRMIIRLLNPTSGQICFNHKDISDLNQRQLRPYRKDMQIIFQDPFASLNSKMNVKELLEEPLIVQTDLSKPERVKRVSDMIQKVGLRKDDLQKYPHQFSGGQRQRICIARALMLRPKFVVCDEPVSALDISIQAQVLNLMKDLQDELGLTYLFIAHDLSVVKHISDRVAVMYLGKIVELAPKQDLYLNPLHPYTRALFSSIPRININGYSHTKKEKIILSGELPSPAQPPSGCAFRTRCPFAFKKCTTIKPELTELRKGHYVACHLN